MKIHPMEALAAGALFCVFVVFVGATGTGDVVLSDGFCEG